MRLRRVKIGIRTLKDGLKHFVEVAEAIEKGKIPKKERGVYFEDLDTMRKVLTDRRLELLKMIKEHKPNSVDELAKLLNRDLKNVNQDLKVLEQAGLVSLKRSKADKKHVTPKVDYDAVDVEIRI